MSGSDIEIVRYTPKLKQTWDDFVESSKNGTFLLNRSYMDYHAEKFEDYSLLIYRKGKLYCLLPANKKEDVIFSHGGLTYGGLIMNEKCTSVGVLEVFDALIQKAEKEGVSKIIYKPVPHIYHSIPSEEDLYALFRNNAKLIERNISCTLSQSHRLKFSNLRQRMIKKSKKENVTVEFSNDFPSFWKILEDNLKLKYGSVPVHSLSEMEYLSNAFPENIKLCVARINGEMKGGVVCYITKEVIHMQYISANEEGKKSGAIDAIIKFLIDEYSHIPYFDLGTSNGNGGKYLNDTLIHQKEGFGGRGICYDIYELKI